MTHFPSTPTRPTLCWRCGYHGDRVSTVIGCAPEPRPGDITICLGCGALGEFNESLGVQLLSDDAVLELDVESQTVLRKAQEFIRRRGPIARGRPQ